MNTINTTMVHLRMDKKIQKDVKKLADSMGVSLSLIGETLFKNFLKEKRLIIDNSYIPNEDLELILNEAEKNRDNEKYWVSHNSIDDLVADLKN